MGVSLLLSTSVVSLRDHRRLCRIIRVINDKRSTAILLFIILIVLFTQVKCIIILQLWLLAGTSIVWLLGGRGREKLLLLLLLDLRRILDFLSIFLIKLIFIVVVHVNVTYSTRDYCVRFLFDFLLDTLTYLLQASLIV